MDPDTVRRAQTKRLRRYLANRVLPFSAHYKKAFAEAGIEARDLRSPDDLAAIPLTAKSDVAASPREFVLIPDEAVLRRQPSTVWQAIRGGRAGAKAALEREFRPLLMTSTTGRSSEPVPFVYTAHDIENLLDAGRRIMDVGESRTDWRHVNLFPYAPHLAFWQAHYAGIGFGTFMVGTGGGKTMGTAGNIAMIEKIRPEVIIGMPTFLYHVLSLAAWEGHRWPQVRKLVLGGEKVPPGTRRKLRTLCQEVGADDVAVMATYAFTEAKYAWMECAAPPGEPSAGYHLWPELGIVEVIDPETGNVRGPGESGEIVYTSLDSRGTVVLRYRTGDITDGGIVWDRCPWCGRVGPRIAGGISRVSEFRRLSTDKLKGTLIDFNELERALDNIDGIGSWQIELRKQNDDPYDQDQVILHAVTGPSGIRESLEQVIRRRFQEVAEIAPNAIRWHTRESLATMQGVGRALKEEKIVDHRPKADAPDSAPAAAPGTTPEPASAPS